MSAFGLAGSILAAVDSFRPSLVARSTGHQALLMGASAVIGYTVGAGVDKSLQLVGLRERVVDSTESQFALVAAAAAVSAPIIAQRSEQERREHADWGGPRMDPAVAVVGGSAIGIAAVGAAHLLHNGVDELAARVGGPPVAWHAAGGALAAGALAVLGPKTKAAMFTRLSANGTNPDPAFSQAPTNPLVSGGPATLVDYPTHAREGSRFVHLACTPARIEEVTGQLAKGPIRVFIGITAGDSAQERVALAVAELERLGAFARRNLLLVSPAGTGYANPVPVEALELLAAGDCATVAIQYGVLPSMFSRDVIPMAAETYRLLVDAVSGRGPRVLCYGESLGAQAAQLALSERWAPDGSFTGIDAALFVGTPAGTGIRARGGAKKPAVLRLDRWENLPEVVPDGIRVFLLDHDADPVTRFETKLIWHRPDWLNSHARGRGVPADMAWRPLLTHTQVLFDVARATQPQLGQFQSHGHDYRADLPRVVRVAFAPDVSADLVPAVEEELVASELRRAELLARE